VRRLFYFESLERESAMSNIFNSRNGDRFRQRAVLPFSGAPECKSDDVVMSCFPLNDQI
jgi:hypothetical protein